MNDTLSLTAAASSDASAFASLPDAVRREVRHWQSALATVQPPLARAFTELHQRIVVILIRVGVADEPRGHDVAAPCAAVSIDGGCAEQPVTVPDFLDVDAAFSTGNVYLRGATLDLNGKTIGNMVYFTGGSLIGGTLLASQLVVEAGNISAVLSGPGTFRKTGTGMLTISGANDFTGGTVIADGILAMGAHDVLPGTITLDGGVENGRYGGVLAMGAFNNSNSTTIVFNGGDVTSTLGFTGVLTGTSFTSTNTVLDASEIRAVLAGAGASLTLSGAGTTALYGVNTYAGGRSEERRVGKEC
jgi:autotransporter-associated beta strand protein